MTRRTATGVIRRENWAEGSTPYHPHFEDETRIREIVRNLKAELISHLVDGSARLFAHQAAPPFDFNNPDTLECWRLALCAQKYGVVYLLSRHQAAAIDPNFLSDHGETINTIGHILRTDGNANRIFNYAIRAYVRSPQRSVTFSNELVPPNGIASRGKDALTVREQDFFAAPAEAGLDTPAALYDLHDFAHQTASTLCPQLYGTTYFDSLIHLPAEMKALILSPGLRTTRAVAFSDGLVFSELLLGLLGRIASRISDAEETVAALAEAAVPYFLDGKELRHPTTNTDMASERPISLDQLGTLVQNKFYELPASEVEQKVLTRGGNDDRDPLAKMTTLERIHFIAGLGSQWLYFEKRNTLRHRAHLDCYRRVAQRLLDEAQEPSDKEFLQLIVDKAHYRPYIARQDRNLWSVVRIRLLSQAEPQHGDLRRPDLKNRGSDFDAPGP
jgi:hypothetical protein